MTDGRREGPDHRKMPSLSEISPFPIGEEMPVFRGFSAEFPRGAITALTGRNGCGKSTLVKNMTGLLRPSSGRILVDGRDIEEMSIAQIAERIGFVMQNPYCQILGLTVREEMETGLKKQRHSCQRKRSKNRILSGLFRSGDIC